MNRLQPALGYCITVMLGFCLIINQPAVMASEKPKTALIIGNADYQVRPLANPVNDVNDMGMMLQRLGFETTIIINADYQQMEIAIIAFGEELRRKGGVGLFFYAGHAIEINHQNYLLPIDIKVFSESDIRFGAVNAGHLLGKMYDAGNEVNIVLLDACRDNPYTGQLRSIKQGLAAMEAPPGTFIGYATAPGKAAEDGTGRNGVFTNYLMKHLDTPGLLIDQVMNRTRRAVIQATGGRQIPWQRSSLALDFRFVEEVDTLQAADPASQREIMARAEPAVQAKTDKGPIIQNSRTVYDVSTPLPTLAVVDFDTTCCPDRQLGRQTAELITDAVVNQGLFRVVERAKLSAVLKELNFSTSGMVTPQSAIAMGKMLGAQYLLTGKILSTDVKQKKFKGYGIRSTQTTASMDVSVRVIDTKTGTILFSATETAASVVQSTNFLTGDPTSFFELAKVVVNKLTRQMTDSGKFHPRDQAKISLAQVSFKSQPDLADVEIDGVFYGNTGGTIKVPSGMHMVKISLPGYDVWQKRVILHEGANIYASLRRSADIRISTE